MRRRGALLIAAIAALGIAVWLVAARRGESEVVFERDVIYARVGDTDLHLNIAVPKSGDGPFPAVVFLHGEGWRAGDRSDMDSLVKGIARLGYVGVTVQYRLVPAARFPAQVEDCKAAVRWMRVHAAQYRIAPQKLAAVGFSAGGYLAAMVGVRGTTGDAVQAVVSFFGPTDFTTRDWPSDLETEVIAPFLGGSFADKPDVYRRASPVNAVTKESPPFLFFHGVEDRLVPVDQSRRLAESLQRAGASARVVEFEHEGHGFTDATNQVAMKQMLEFLHERFGQ